MSARFDIADLVGLDPYDALRGTRVPGFVRSSRRLRQLVIQARKLSPLDLAPLLGVRPFVMAKAVACFLSAHARWHALEPADNDRALAESLVSLLEGSEGNVGGGAWGYEFDVQTRWAFYAAGSPNLIATVFVGRAYLEAGIAFARDDWLERGFKSARYLSHSHRTGRPEAPFFTYTQDSDELVHNANLLGCALCAAVGALSRDTDLVSQSRECARISLDAQRADGSWPYGASETLTWSDNFHTAYNLDSLLTLWLATGDGRVSATLAKGIEDWVERFFDANGAALYYRDGSGPLDIHCAATAIDTAARLSTHGYETLGIARGARDAVSRTLLDPSTGATWFRRYRLLTDRRRFVRWGDAHWMLARSALASAEASAPTPLEAAIRGAV